MNIHHTVGVYPNGQYKENGVLPVHLFDHVQYNMFWRPGRALFVDGTLVYAGIMTPESLANAIKTVATLPPVTQCTVPYH
jgi:hypothetical protein